MQINKAVNDTIKNTLIGTDFEGIEPIATDFTDGIPRPALRVIFNNTTTGKFNKNLKERTLTCRVYFYAKDKNKYKIDNLKMQDIIENVFLEDVKVTDTFYMPIIGDGIESDVVDTVLECSFDLYSLEDIIDDSMYEDIEELNLKLEEQGDNYDCNNAEY